MAHNNGTQTIDAHEEQTATVVDLEASDSTSRQQTGKRQPATRRKRLLVISAVIVAAIAGGYFAWNVLQYEDTDDAQVDGRVMPLSARINGQIKDVYVSEGQLVHAGDALVTIDPQDYKIAEELAQVNVFEAEATAARFHSNTPITSVTIQSYRDSANRASGAAADAEVWRRELQLAQAELNLSYTVILSPVTGVVGKTRVEVGENVNIGQEVVDVVPLDDVWVTANFKETQLAHVRAGQPVEIKVDAYGRTWKGRITNLGGGTGSVFNALPPENATRNYVKVVPRVPVRIDFDRTVGQDFNTEGLLKPGLSAEPHVRVR